MRPRIMFVMAAIVLASAASVQATTFDMFSDYHTADNTASQMWQYMSTDTPGTNGTYSLMPNYGTTVYHGVGWTDLGGVVDITAADGTLRVAPDWTILTTPKAAAIGWKSPGTGMVEEIRIAITEISTQPDSLTIPRDGVDYYLFDQNSTLLASGYVGGTLSSGPITLPTDFAISTGDMLHLQVGPGSVNHWYDFAAVNFQVDYVPEPSTIVMLTCGLLSLLAYAWRKRK